jgi:hypothetical protein
MELSELNILAVLVAALSAFIIGFFWLPMWWQEV